MLGRRGGVRRVHAGDVAGGRAARVRGGGAAAGASGDRSRGLPTTGAEFPLAEHPNLQLALDAVLGDAEHVGFTARHMGFGSIGLAEIVAGQAMTGPITLGPVRYVDVEVGDGRVVQCIESALLLAVHEEAPLALVLSRGGDNPMRPSSLRLEGVSPAPGRCRGCCASCARRCASTTCSAAGSSPCIKTSRAAASGSSSIPSPRSRGTDVILPEGALERLERHTLGITPERPAAARCRRRLGAGCCCTGRPGRARRSRRCTCCARWPAARPSC